MDDNPNDEEAATSIDKKIQYNTSFEIPKNTGVKRDDADIDKIDDERNTYEEGAGIIENKTQKSISSGASNSSLGNKDSDVLVVSDVEKMDTETKNERATMTTGIENKSQENISLEASNSKDENRDNMDGKTNTDEGGTTVTTYNFPKSPPFEASKKKDEIKDDDSISPSVPVKVRKIQLLKPPPIIENSAKKTYTRVDALNLLNLASSQIDSARAVLDEARPIFESTGLNVDSSILDPSYQTPLIPSNKSMASTNNTNNNINSTNPNSSTKLKFVPHLPVLETTGGHSNTDHVVQYTGDYKEDRIAEMKRNLKRRARAMLPEEKGSKRWDIPFRIAGSRRRRIVREKDLPSAPLEPPISGYVLFVAQMTAKMRHDRPSNKDQIKIVKEISKIWNYGMDDEEKEYYLESAAEAKAEYDEKLREFRATGGYEKSEVFEKLGEVGPLVRKKWEDKNDLERDISSYSLDEFKERPDFRLKYYLKQKEEIKRKKRKNQDGKEGDDNLKSKSGRNGGKNKKGKF